MPKSWQSWPRFAWIFVNAKSLGSYCSVSRLPTADMTIGVLVKERGVLRYVSLCFVFELKKILGLLRETFFVVCGPPPFYILKRLTVSKFSRFVGVYYRESFSRLVCLADALIAAILYLFLRNFCRPVTWLARLGIMRAFSVGFTAWDLN